MFFSAAVVLAMTAGVACADSTASSDDRQAVERAVATFYASLNALFEGEVLPMQQVWSHADDVTYMGPLGGIETGWDEVSAIWQHQADLTLGGYIEPSEIDITIGNDLAFVECYEVGGNLESSGKPLNISIRATSQFRKENGEWKMIGHHTDPIPGLEQEENQDESQPQEPVVTFDSEQNPPAAATIVPEGTPATTDGGSQPDAPAPAGK